MPGIDMSSTITSGRSVAAASIPARPFVAVPTSRRTLSARPPRASRSPRGRRRAGRAGARLILCLRSAASPLTGSQWRWRSRTGSSMWTRTSQCSERFPDVAACEHRVNVPCSDRVRWHVRPFRVALGERHASSSFDRTHRCAAIIRKPRKDDGHRTDTSVHRQRPQEPRDRRHSLGDLQLSTKQEPSIDEGEVAPCRQ
jgi:hypothetical protein